MTAVATETAVIYARISKDAQGEALGVDRQEKACRALAKARGLRVVDVLVDNDVSAFKGNRRPQFDALVDLLAAGSASTVLAYHPDRLYRRTTDLERLVDVVERHKADVLTVAAGSVDLTTASGRMVARMLGAAAQHESERTGERARMKHDELAARGRAPGGRAPFGYRWEFPERQRDKGTYIIEPTEAEAVRTMARRVLEGASILSVARELDAAGVQTREGRSWHHASVRATLLNPAIAGLRIHRREVAGEGEWQPILDRATWESVRAVIADPSRKRTRPARVYVLTGLVSNPNGDPMNGCPDRASDGSATRRTYTTRSPAKPSLSVDADALEDFVERAVLAALDKAVIPMPTSQPDTGAEVAAIEAELVELAELRGNNTVTLAEWLAAREPLQRRLEAARAAAGSTARPTPLSTLLAKPGAARAAWPQLSVEQKRQVVQTVVEKVTVNKASRGRWTPLAERVEVRWRA